MRFLLRNCSIYTRPFSFSKNPVGFRRESGERIIIVFDGGVYVGKNTSRPANVRGVPRKPRALRQGANPIAKKATAFLAV